MREGHVVDKVGHQLNRGQRVDRTSLLTGNGEKARGSGLESSFGLGGGMLVAAFGLLAGRWCWGLLDSRSRFVRACLECLSIHQWTLVFDAGENCGCGRGYKRK